MENIRHFTKRFSLAASAAAVCALTLAGCQTTGQKTASAPSAQESSSVVAESVNRFDDGTYGFMLTQVPSIKGAKPLGLTTLQAFEGEGVYYFYDREESNFRIDQKKNDTTYTVKETYPKGQKAHGFAWGTNVNSIVRSGNSVSAEFPSYLTSEPDGSVKLYSDNSKNPVAMRLKLYAFDVSGQYIYHYLRSRTNYPTPAAGVISARFPKGSVVYMPQIAMTQDQYVVLKPDAFTGAGNVEGFVRTFSRDIPYCLSYLPRVGFKAYGVVFDPTAGAAAPTQFKVVTKTRYVKNKRGKRVKQRYQEKVAIPAEGASAIPTNGEVSLYSVKTGTVFCQSTSKTPETRGSYSIKTVDGTKGIAFSFPSTVKAPDTGIFELSRDAVSLALVEIHRGKSTTVVPGYFVKADKPITDFQYRFNGVAAKAVREALASVRQQAQK